MLCAAYIIDCPNIFDKPYQLYVVKNDFDNRETINDMRNNTDILIYNVVSMRFLWL